MIYLLSSIFIIIINVVPSFMPPTWTVISFVYINYNVNLFLLTIIGSISSSTGRLFLAKLSGKFTEKLLSKEVSKSLNFLGKRIRKSPKSSFLAAFAWALSPIASNYLFIAVGSTKSKMRYVLTGFFLGRTISYFGLAYTSNLVYEGIRELLFENIFDWRKLAFNLFGLIIIFGYLLLDWKKLIIDKKIRFNRRVLKKRSSQGHNVL